MSRFRKIAILPLMMSLLSSLAAFLLGAKQIIGALLMVAKCGMKLFFDALLGHLMTALVFV